MISESLTLAGGSLPLVPRDTTSVDFIQPVADVAVALKNRKPLSQPIAEDVALFITLPLKVRSEVWALVRACELVRTLTTGKQAIKVQPACERAIRVFKDRHWNLKTFRALYDNWNASGDWVVLVNRTKAGKLWQKRDDGLNESFLDFVARRFGEFKRDDGKRQALMSIKRQWQTGRNDRGEAEMIPGYELLWNARERAIIPDGWSYSNILRQIKARSKFTEATRALLHLGTAAAKEFVPQVNSTREGLRFMEEVQFDDVKTDWRVFDPQTGQPMDLWLLVARDRATALLLGFGMRPARVREDGSQEHLKLIDMKQLCGWLLERYGLPPYEMIWKIERGTATLSAGSAAALAELLPDRIRVSFSSMLGGNSPAGYFERRIGNSKGKASLESHNRLMHTIGANVDAQTGPSYGKRPADLAAREKEAVEIWKLAQMLPESLRGQAQYPVLTLAQARAELQRIFAVQNNRTEHSLEGFEEILEWFDEGRGLWLPQSQMPDGELQLRKRKESPIERGARLVAGLEWTRVSPEIIRAFYEHTQRPVKVEESGEIEFLLEGKKIYFLPPPGAKPLPPGTKLLGYLNPDEPRFLHLTDGDGRIVGTWLRKALVKHHDEDALQQALRYGARAMSAVKEYAETLASDERARLEAMRQHNAELIQSATFIEVTPAAATSTGTLRSPVAAALASTAVTKKEIKNLEKQRAEDERIAREALEL